MGLAPMVFLSSVAPAADRLVARVTRSERLSAASGASTPPVSVDTGGLRRTGLPRRRTAGS
jgi:hypothetical protein